MGVQGTHVIRSKGESARSSMAENVRHILNMLRRVCVLQIPYGDSTHHVLSSRFASRQHILASTAGDRYVSKLISFLYMLEIKNLG